MKKILALAIVIIMTLSITACSSNTDNQVSEEPTVDEPVVEQSMVDAFIEKYNEIATTPITDVVGKRMNFGFTLMVLLLNKQLK